MHNSVSDCIAQLKIKRSDLLSELDKIDKTISTLQDYWGGDDSVDFREQIRDRFVSKFKEPQVNKFMELVDANEIRKLNGCLNTQEMKWRQHTLILCYQHRVSTGQDNNPTIKKGMQDALRRYQSEGTLSQNDYLWFKERGYFA